MAIVQWLEAASEGGPSHASEPGQEGDKKGVLHAQQLEKVRRTNTPGSDSGT
jgi:hypothetical protein